MRCSLEGRTGDCHLSEQHRNFPKALCCFFFLVSMALSTLSQRSSHWKARAQINVSEILHASVSLFGGHFVCDAAGSSPTTSQDDVAVAAPRSEGGRRRNPGDNGRKWFFVRVASRVDVITPNHRVPGGRQPHLRHARRRSLTRRAAASCAPLRLEWQELLSRRSRQGQRPGGRDNGGQQQQQQRRGRRALRPKQFTTTPNAKKYSPEVA